ncbi:MAG: LysR family transcriptional regulator, partial [Ghiorsea sp.]
MTLEQLKYLCAIVETGSFRSAAESVFRSQSSLSISIKKLETELGIALFTREDYRPKLTDAGQVMYQKALRLKQHEQEMLTLAEHLAKGLEAELRVSVSGIVPIEPIIQVFNSIKQQYPATRLSLLTENLAGTLERLYDDDADIAISEVFDSEVGYENEVIT